MYLQVGFDFVRDALSKEEPFFHSSRGIRVCYGVPFVVADIKDVAAQFPFAYFREVLNFPGELAKKFVWFGSCCPEQA